MDRYVVEVVIKVEVEAYAADDALEALDDSARCFETYGTILDSQVTLIEKTD